MKRCGPASPGSALVGAAALYAATNLALALALTSEPGRAADLMVLRDWCARWLLAGERLYSAPGSVTDYPPNAVVLLAPLALIPLAALIPVWATVTALATPAFAYVVVNVIAPRAQQAAVALPMLLFLCWGGVRMLLQFTRVSVLLAFGAVWCADSRPIVSGLLLGVALIKPQIAGPIALWMLLTRRWRPLGVACGVVALGTLVYAIRVQSNPLQTIVNYASVLDGLYGDPTAFLGRTSIRRWIYGLAGVSPLSNLLWLTTAALLLLVPCAAAVAEARRRVPRAAGAVPALFCLWSLLVWFHLGNNLVLMFPAFAFLLLLDDPRTLWQRRAIVAIAQVVLMIEPAVHLRGYALLLGPFSFVVRDASRIVVLSVFCYLGWIVGGLIRDQDKDTSLCPCPDQVLRNPATG